MVQTNNMSNILAEIYDCLNILGRAYIDCIPTDMYEKIKDNRSLDYVSKYNPEIGITEETFSKDAINILSGLDLKYWCTEEEKKEKTETYKKNEEKYQKELKEKYSVDDIFKNNEKVVEKKENVNIQTEKMVVYENKSIFGKIKEFIKNIFVL